MEHQDFQARLKKAQERAELMRKFNEESRRETEAMGEKWIETTALDAKLSRGSAVIALNIANVVDEARARPSKGIRSVNSAPLRQVRFTFH